MIRTRATRSRAAYRHRPSSSRRLHRGRQRKAAEKLALSADAGEITGEDQRLIIAALKKKALQAMFLLLLSYVSG
jgi:hypothetical protein